MTSLTIHALFQPAATARTSTAPVHATHAQRTATLYASLLSHPMAQIAGNVSDRSDVSSVAILGYN
ncbi:hypothetical protein [Paraburkholderia acidisoli]|uniref:Uncharacterized protein n=1 Tax=Paraburkholderia acidisoli TaxID=2571748 RepID=A0A7Z2GKE7_9BURK|nr:hypothetical protein [Paraburkholderia acidisoli]QGZ63326.1 hypothetical protein FAZ98_16115 [Paraburkholderia acidisoli]